jgi:hypothetical protein
MCNCPIQKKEGFRPYGYRRGSRGWRGMGGYGTGWWPLYGYSYYDTPIVVRGGDGQSADKSTDTNMYNQFQIGSVLTIILLLMVIFMMFGYLLINKRN